MPTRRRHRVKRTRKVRRVRRGGYDPVRDNASYPTKMNGYPTLSNFALPDPRNFTTGITS